VIFFVSIILRYTFDSIMGAFGGHMVAGLTGGVATFLFALLAMAQGPLIAFYYAAGALAVIVLFGLGILSFILSIATDGKGGGFSGGGGGFGGGGASGSW